MMDLEGRIEAFTTLGSFLRQFAPDKLTKTAALKRINDLYYDPFEQLIRQLHLYNAWFTEDNVRESINAISNSLAREKIDRWLRPYSLPGRNPSPKKIAVVMAGNIPLVGFHDMLSVLISGNVFIGKTSAKDEKLIKAVADILIAINPGFKNHIFFEDNQLGEFDAVIATGSDNTSRYFEYYFGKYPHLIRKNRNSIAVLSGQETQDKLKALGEDIFLYFGLGCRNVSKLFVPAAYNFDSFFQSIEHYQYLYNHNKYANNYDYNKSVYLLNQTPHLDNGFVLIKEDKGFSSPVGTIFYECYSDKLKLFEYLQFNKDKIQCVVSDNGFVQESISFGMAQKPELWDYADCVDTMKFLINLN